MLADFVMKNIDNIFSQKLKANANSKQITTLPTPSPLPPLDQLIRKSLHKVIRKDKPLEASPLPRQDTSTSPSRSKLRLFLQSNREEKIRSVLRGKEGVEMGSTRMEAKVDYSFQNKENNVAKYYQEMRKSVERSQQRSKSAKKGLQLSKASNKSAMIINPLKRDTRATVRY